MGKQLPPNRKNINYLNANVAAILCSQFATLSYLYCGNRHYVHILYCNMIIQNPKWQTRQLDVHISSVQCYRLWQLSNFGTCRK